MGDSLTPFDLRADAVLDPSLGFTCVYCGGHSDNSNCCKSCTRVRVRIHRVMKGDSELAKAWNLTQNKASLIAKAKDAFGDALFTLLKTTLVEEHEHKSEMSFTGTGNWREAEDLRIMYKDRPERLDAILKHARRYICPTTGAEFIEEMTYTSVSTASETHRSREKREFEGTENLSSQRN